MDLYRNGGRGVKVALNGENTQKCVNKHVLMFSYKKRLGFNVAEIKIWRFNCRKLMT